jgi:CRISPR-associated protein Csd1
MILQALKEYYDRKAADDESDIAPQGWERKEIPFLIILNSDGMPVNIVDTREGEGKKKRAKSFLLPQSVKRTVGIAANLLWDNPAYALGFFVPDEKRKKADRSADCHEAFVKRINELNLAPSSAVSAVVSFLQRPNKIELLQQYSEQWNEIAKTGPFLSFKLAGEPEPVFRDSAVVVAVSNLPSQSDKSNIPFCFVTGNHEATAILHPPIKGVAGANGTGANIVGFNSAAFCSHGKTQGENSPIGEFAAFAYTTALNTLLSRDSKQRLLVGDATTVFWAAKPDEFESNFLDCFNEPPKDNPDRLTEAVAALYHSTETGAYALDSDDTRFYVLGLSPNAARICIRFWRVGTVAELAKNFRAWFNDLKITHGPKDKDSLPLWRYLVSLAALEKSENIPPNLAGNVTRAILDNSPLPMALLQAAILRNRAEQDVSYPRAALIKAYFNRNNSNNERTLTMSLDKDNNNIGYRLGRLFAALERIQETANPGINATIRDRFYASASGTPATVFGTLMRLKNHHLAKLENVGARVNLERLLGEIISTISDFPAHLSLADQGRFAIGYYHQRQDFFTKKN